MKEYMLTALALLCLCLLGNNALCSSINDPEKSVLEYAKSYQNQKWSEAVIYLHPNLLKDMQNQIIGIVKRVKQADLNEILAKFGVRTIKELEIMSAEQFFIVNQQRRCRDAKIDTDLMKRTQFEVISIKQNNENEYLIELKSTVEYKNTQKEEYMTYYVVEFENNWKIIKTARHK